jgi:hypothetical protein
MSVNKILLNVTKETSPLANIPENIAKDLLNIADFVLIQQNLSSQSFIIIISKLIRGVEKYKSLSGVQKKEIIICILQEIIITSDADPLLKVTLGNIVDTIVPETIDAMVAFANSEEFKKKTKKCFRKCLPCY